MSAEKYAKTEAEKLELKKHKSLHKDYFKKTGRHNVLLKPIVIQTMTGVALARLAE